MSAARVPAVAPSNVRGNETGPSATRHPASTRTANAGSGRPAFSRNEAASTTREPWARTRSINECICEYYGDKRSRSIRHQLQLHKTKCNHRKTQMDTDPRSSVLLRCKSFAAWKEFFFA